MYKSQARENLDRCMSSVSIEGNGGDKWRWTGGMEERDGSGGGMIIKCVSETTDNCVVMEYYYKLFEWNCIVSLEMWKNLT